MITLHVFRFEFPLFIFLRPWENRTATTKFSISTVLERIKKMERRDEKQGRLHDVNKPPQQQQHLGDF